MPAKHQGGGVDIRVLLEIATCESRGSCVYAMIFSFSICTVYTSLIDDKCRLDNWGHEHFVYRSNYATFLAELKFQLSVPDTTSNLY